MTDLTLNNIESDLLKSSNDAEAVVTSLIAIDSSNLQTSVNSTELEDVDPNELLSDIEKNMSSIESDTTDLPADLLEAVPQRNDEEKNVEYILIGEEEDQIVTKEPSDDPVKELQTMEVCEKVNELNANCKELLDEKEKESQSLESSTISDVKCSSGEMLTLENAEVEKSLNETGHAKLGKNIEKLEENKTVENEIKQDENFKATELEMITKETLHKSEERNEIVEENTQNHTKESNMENTELSVNKNDLELEKNEDDINNKEELDNNENDKQKIEIKVEEEETKSTAVIMEEEASVVQRENIEAAEKLSSKDEIKQVEVVMEQTKEEINKSPKEPANHSDVSDVSDVIQLLDDADMSKQKNNENESEKLQKQQEMEFDNVKESIKEDTTKENKYEDTGENLESTKAGPFLQPANSDNACDKFTTKKPSEEKEAEKTAEKADNEDDGEENYNENKNKNENENDLDDNEGDLEIIENETKETEEKSDETMPPPLKRQRLSMDNEETQVSTAVVAQTEEDRNQKISDKKAENKNETTENTTRFLKRSHEVNELKKDVGDDQAAKTVESNKKVKTEDGLKTVTLVEVKKENVELIGVPSHIQIPLYPPPKRLNTSTTTAKDSKVSLDFLKRFSKTFDKMTKQDLEEMILQKVVEAIIHKSEFSEMRELIDKQEKMITGHRNKIRELTKQFRDLEMIHSRVLKDIELRNSQFIMPVKIMRPVGLQVNIPSKKNITKAINRSSQTSPHRSGGILPQQLISPQRPMTSTNISDNFTTLSTRTSNNAASSSLSSSLSAIAVQKNPETIAFIDLTDDDEAPPPAPSMTLPEGGGVTQGRISPAAANVNTQYNRPTPPLAGVSAMTFARGRTPLQSPLNSLTKDPAPPYLGMDNTNASGGGITRVNVASNSAAISRPKYNHPAPLPPTQPHVFNLAWKLPPPRPTVRICNVGNSIIISWTVEESLEHYDECVTYQIYAYPEPVGPPSADSWRHVGDVRAMLLPMAVTLKQIRRSQRYYFAVRAIDCHQRYGPFSLPKTWSQAKK